MPRGGVRTHAGGCGESHQAALVCREKCYEHLEEDDEEKLHYLVFVIAASKTFVKSTYAMWLRYFDESEGSQSGMVVEALLSYWLSWFVLLSGLEDDLDAYVFPLPVFLRRGRG